MMLREIVATFCIFAILHVVLAHSKGETFHGDRTSFGYTESYFYNPNPYIHPAYPLPQYQLQSFPNYQPTPSRVAPEYYTPNNQNYKPQQSNPSQLASQHVQPLNNNRYPSQIPSVYNTPQNYLSNPQSYQQNAQSYQNSPSVNGDYFQRNPSFDTRIGDEPHSEELTTRPPSNKPKKTATTRPPPQPLLNSRFDDRNSAAFKKTLSFDTHLSDAMEVFSLKLFDQFCYTQPNENFMISPFSIYHLLVLIAEGANGNTLKELTEKMNFTSLPRTRDFQQYLSESFKRNTARIELEKYSMLVTDRARPIRTEFENLIEQTYDAEVEPVNFLDVDRTVKYINDKVSEKTKGQITDTVNRDDLFKAQLILLSSLFFRGDWMNVFNTSFTRKEPFYDTNGRQTGEVNMMFQRGSLAYTAIPEIGCHVLELPYAEKTASRGEIYGSGLSMIVLLPKKGLSLSDAMASVYQFTMNKIYKALYDSKLEYDDEEVEVHLPRFEISTAFDIKEALKTLGIRDAFDQSRADLSNINQNYFVSSMIHKTQISVDEKGTTAAAVTTSIFANKATPPKFHANKPFLFFIVDKSTNLILFSGQYVAPELF